MLSHEELLAFFYYSPIAQVVVDKNFCFQEVNDAMCELLGYRREEILFQPCQRFTHPDDIEKSIDFGRRLMERPLCNLDLEKRFVRRDGMVIHVRISSLVLPGRERVLNHIVDLSSAQIAKRDLALMESVVLNTGDAILIGEPQPPSGKINGRPILFGNDSFTRMTGFVYEEYVGKTTDILFGPETDLAKLAPIFEGMLRGEPQHYETVLYRKDRSQFNAEVSAMPVIDDSKITNWVLVLRDITDRTRYIGSLKVEKERAEAASRAKTDFLANMSHELRTPLNAIIGYSEVMSQQLFGPIGAERYVTYARDIHNSGLHLLDIINDILDMSKIEAGKQELDEEVYSLHEVCEGSMLFVGARAEQKCLKLFYDRESVEQLYIFGDRRGMRQILINLLSNAVKFTSKDGEVTLGAYLSDEHIVVFVRDTGIGMNPEFISRIGAKFLQAEAVATKTYEGTGLGLSLVKELVEMHGGELVVDSVVGHGTTISILLPRHRLRDPAA